MVGGDTVSPAQNLLAHLDDRNVADWRAAWEHYWYEDCAEQRKQEEQPQVSDAA